MQSAIAAILGFSVLVAPAMFADPTVGEGAALYDARCKLCHATGVGGAPLVEKMATLDPTYVVDKLTSGTMSAMASGISAENKRDIAVYLTKKPLAAQDGMPAVTAE